ncbi:MAG: flagellar biosynthesis anti-sigma factor FlgM [Bdellovibrionota bacterium]
MKITHNKLGQNLNLVDGAKTDALKNTKSEKSSLPLKDLGSRDLNESSRVDLSPRAQEARRIKELAKAAPDVDMVKVEKFRQLIDEGKYKVDAKAVADKMVDEHLEMES